jgi:hypothetical protein
MIAGRIPRSNLAGPGKSLRAPIAAIRAKIAFDVLDHANYGLAYLALSGRFWLPAAMGNIIFY